MKFDSKTATAFINECELELKDEYRRLDEIALANQKKVLDAFKKHEIQARHMCGTTGYGYDDIGRDALCAVFADVLGAEKALVSPHILSGTHALTLMLFGILRPDDTVLFVSGKPYDTLDDLLSKKDSGSLADFNIKSEIIELGERDENPVFNFEKIKEMLTNRRIKAVFAARSRGYAMRNALSLDDVAKLAKFVKEISPETLVIIDNCYGEFVSELEPPCVGADLCAGSLIKNVGGGIAPTGGYIAGRADLVELVAYRLTSPSLGMEIGSHISGYLPYYQGLFFAPSVVKNALKAAILFAKAYRKLGFNAIPNGKTPPQDIICSLQLNSEARLIDFCQAIQEISPIDSNVTPEPWEMPGYQDKVIMAAGTFMQGASIELSADSPLKPPFVAYIQGALTYEHAVLALEHTLIRTIN